MFIFTVYKRKNKGQHQLQRSGMDVNHLLIKLCTGKASLENSWMGSSICVWRNGPIQVNEGFHKAILFFSSALC